jgi:hypothetical protein
MKLTGENRSTRRKTCPSATLSTTNPTWADPGSNPGLRGGRPTANRLSHGTALEADTYKTNIRDEHPCPQQDSNPRPQQLIRRRPTPETARLPRCAKLTSTFPFICAYNRKVFLLQDMRPSHRGSRRSFLPYAVI